MLPFSPNAVSAAQPQAVVACVREYSFGDKIGAGNFATVYAAQDNTSGEQVAIKMVCKSEASQRDKAHCGRPFMERAAREVEHLRSLQHPHIIRLYGFLEAWDVYLMVLERAADQCLFDLVVERGGQRPKEARRIFQQVIAAVEYCHSNGIVHRDIKLDNILLDFEKNAKLADFELSAKIQEGQLLSTWCGSPEYVAPEIILHRPYWGPGVDVWSCGVVLYALLCGKYPWGRSQIPDILRRIKRCKYTIPVYFPDALADLIRQIFVVDPAKRYSIRQIQVHPWFAQDWPGHLQDERQAS